MLNKKAQIGETMTWVIATIIIVIVLIFFIYASSFLAQKNKKVEVSKFLASLSGDDLGTLLETKTSLAYGLSRENREIIDNWIMEAEDE